MRSLILRAHAKINLYLNVLSKRLDGYHEVQSIMQSVVLSDLLSLSMLSERTIKFSCDNTLLSSKDNLVYKTALLFQRKTNVKAGAAISLKKNIPVAAGLGGGSADAAATLVGLNKLWGLNLSRKELLKVASEIGADVPFCLLGGTALAEGIGEKLASLSFFEFPVVVATPPLKIFTKEVYLNLDQESHPPLSQKKISKMIVAINEKSLEEVCSNLANLLEGVVLRKYPAVEDLKKRALEAGAMGVLMSGSGPSIFALAPTAQRARKVAKKLKEFCPTTIVTHSYHQGVEIV